MWTVKQRGFILAGRIILILLGMFPTIMLSEDTQRMSQEELKAMLSKLEVVFIDVRANVDWISSKF